MKKVDGLMPELRRIATDPALVREVKRQNARRVPLEEMYMLQWKAKWPKYRLTLPGR